MDFSDGFRKVFSFGDFSFSFGDFSFGDFSFGDFSFGDFSFSLDFFSIWVFCCFKLGGFEESLDCWDVFKGVVDFFGRGVFLGSNRLNEVSDFSDSGSDPDSDLDSDLDSGSADSDSFLFFLSIFFFVILWL